MKRHFNIDPARHNPAAWQTHRFADTVAVYIGTGATVYLTPWAALELSRALSAGARDCRAVKYADSTYRTRSGYSIKTPADSQFLKA